MLNKKDIKKYSSKNKKNPNIQKSEDNLAAAAGATIQSAHGMLWSTLFTCFVVLCVAGVVVLVSVISFILTLTDTSISGLDLLSVSESSNMYVYNDDGEAERYMVFHQDENRAWVDYADIPQIMIDAQVAIEDKRFWEHNGVDWWNTLGAAYNLLTGSDSTRGGSTITQQLIKNVTGDNEVSITRKLNEIFTALNLEKDYTKDQIIEYYLNIVSYGYGAYGVESASLLYFGHSITEASIAECAMIAGITQNPYYYSPIYSTENAEYKAGLVLYEMYDQGYITLDEYNIACEELQNMNYTFVGSSSTTGTEENTVVSSNSVWNWYTEYVFLEVAEDLQEMYNVSYSEATNMIYNGGLNIYSAMDLEIQTEVEDIIMDIDNITGDEKLQAGFYMIDYDGRLIATVGSVDEKDGNIYQSWATNTMRSPGSSIKPLSVYAPAIELGLYTYSTIVADEPLEDYYGEGKEGPYNYSRVWTGNMTLANALWVSQNAPAAQILNVIGLDTSFTFLTERLHFTTLVDADMDFSPLATGGMTYGVNLDEMVESFQIFGNGGEYYDTYSYYYVTDTNGDIILDNRDPNGEKVLSETDASIMNKLLQEVIYQSNGTGRQVEIDGLTIFGKTGTTDNIDDLWFIGGTPYAVSGVWTGYAYPDTKDTIDNEVAAKQLWLAVNEYMWETYWSVGEEKEFEYSDQMVARTYCTDTGLIAGTYCQNTATGYYSSSDVIAVCNGGSDHIAYGEDSDRPEEEDDEDEDEDE